jgi:hypothetical protein
MVKIKVPVKELEKRDTCELVEETLRKDPTNAYTVSGIMIKAFDVKEKDISNKAFRDWPKGFPTLYSRITKCLSKLKKDLMVKSTKHGKAWVYWWVSEYDRDHTITEVIRDKKGKTIGYGKERLMEKA